MKQFQSILLMTIMLVHVHESIVVGSAKKAEPKAKKIVSAAKTAPIKPVASMKREVVKASPSIPVQPLEMVPGMKQFEQGEFSPEQLKVIGAAWTELYNFVKANNQPGADGILTPQQAVAIAPLFEISWLDEMLTYLNPKTFPELKNDPQSKIHKNYALDHLRAAIARLNSVFAFNYNNGSPQALFDGNICDIGVIVNVQNNTKAQFSIHQAALDGTSKSHIGQINPGMNGVNLHTAALQLPATQKTAGTQEPSAYSFEFHEMSSENPTSISIRMMSGSQLVEFLRTLPRDAQAVAKDTFQMNGLPTSPEYLANPQDSYLVLIQNPTPATSTHRRPDQRIQGVNISKLSGPYMVTIQINEQEFEMKGSDAAMGSMQTLYQSSCSAIQLMQNQAIGSLDIPLLILPKFLWDIPHMQSLWMLLATTMIATQTEGKFFGINSFGNAFEYFNNLNCFSSQNRYSLFIDLYNRFRPDYVIYNAPWLMAHAVFETDIPYCSDITQIYTAQDPYGHIIVNEHKFYYTNFLTIITPDLTPQDSAKTFAEKGFNDCFVDPANQPNYFLVNALVGDIKAGIFGELVQKDSGVYELTWTNKKNQVLASHKLHLNASLASVQVAFVNQSVNWIGSSVPINVRDIQLNQPIKFKVNYEYSAANEQHILLAQPTSPIDKQEVILPLLFLEYPIKNFYIDVFHKLNVAPYTRCFVIKDGIAPEPLSSLTQQDWQSGIYMIPVVHDNEKISPQNPGALTLVFYKSDKTILGEITLRGRWNNTDTEGILEPVHAYNPYFSELNCQRDLYFSTGVLLKNQPQNQH